MKLFPDIPAAVYRLLFLAPLTPQIASPANIVDGLPLTDRIVVVHFDEGHVIRIMEERCVL